MRAGTAPLLSPFMFPVDLRGPYRLEAASTNPTHAIAFARIDPDSPFRRALTSLWNTRIKLLTICSQLKRNPGDPCTCSCKMSAKTRAMAAESNDVYAEYESSCEESSPGLLLDLDPPKSELDYNQWPSDIPMDSDPEESPPSPGMLFASSPSYDLSTPRQRPLSLPPSPKPTNVIDLPQTDTFSDQHIKFLQDLSIWTFEMDVLFSEHECSGTHAASIIEYIAYWLPRLTMWILALPCRRHYQEDPSMDFEPIYACVLTARALVASTMERLGGWVDGGGVSAFWGHAVNEEDDDDDEMLLSLPGVDLSLSVFSELPSMATGAKRGVHHVNEDVDRPSKRKCSG